MKALPIVIAVLLLAVSASGQAQPDLEMPGSTGLRAAPRVTGSEVVEFAGSTAVHGILVAQWLPNAHADESAGPSYQLLLVPQSAAQLPHFKGAPLRFINVSNGRLVLATATSQAIARKFHARKLGVVHVEGIFSIRNLKIGLPCSAAASAEVGDADPVRVRYPSSPEAIQCPK